MPHLIVMHSNESAVVDGVWWSLTESEKFRHVLSSRTLMQPEVEARLRQSAVPKYVDAMSAALQRIDEMDVRFIDELEECAQWTMGVGDWELAARNVGC